MNNLTFICQLSADKQAKIQHKVKQYLTKENYSKTEINEIVDNVMSDRLCILEEFMSMDEFLN